MAKKILIVDDAQFMRMMIKDVVSSLQLEVVGEACNGEEGVKMYQELKPDLVTLDLVMPKMGGIEAMKAIREFDPEAKVIVVSAIDQREILMEAIRLGAQDFIVKPFEETRVQSAIQKALGE
ncbi:MAG: response regulator [Deltaproteobacteria bacterium]|nr:response regulator [Deltaproteobacteria bacterium]